jgi:hypothetical protein
MTHVHITPIPPRTGGGSGIRVERSVLSAGNPPWLWLVRSPVEAAPPIGLVLLDALPGERAAIAATMKRVALLMDEIGWATPLAGLTEAQVRALIEEAVEGFREAMSDIARAQTPEVPF